MYACNLQNKSGGWFERYPLEYRNDDEMTHVHNDESCCAVKYFLDALYYKNLAQFELQSYRFWDDIDIQDGRYQCIRSVIDKTGSYGKVLDIGCGKGRYLKKLVKEYPDKNYYAVDLSLSVMDYFNINGVEKYQGNLTNIRRSLYGQHIRILRQLVAFVVHALDCKSILLQFADGFPHCCPADR